ncbi:L-serine ammonia-lyase [Mycobacteroides abscessus subsp. massiliense]|nr:L-serine ammonia-lyase [Mycobacteroides abscessus subsp. massiliense]
MISIFDIFKIGIGPSSSHTVGPMKAAAAFADLLYAENLDTQVARIVIEVYGCLVWKAACRTIFRLQTSPNAWNASARSTF